MQRYRLRRRAWRSTTGVAGARTTAVAQRRFGTHVPGRRRKRRPVHPVFIIVSPSAHSLGLAASSSERGGSSHAAQQQTHAGIAPRPAWQAIAAIVADRAAPPDRIGPPRVPVDRLGNGTTR
ncbi:hypothetical protein EXE55_21035 [Burkholderia glumae]|uniref:hypothetical protein n=1 Tax=Burkholderia glumae TaxID=337 RepID=UPI00137417FE|nr:hypothetical protein [Burkholderia glumae]MCR1769600.1 hypothetical protein [Burkholderia glumae]QHP93389.1 hypothetical protein EXE55_21035 [Burkholderia glumae]